MELPSEFLEQMVFNRELKIEEHVLVVMDKLTHEEILSQSIQSNNQIIEVAVTFLTGCNDFFNLRTKINEFYSTVSINNDDFSVITISTDAYEIEYLNLEIVRNNTKEG